MISFDPKTWYDGFDSAQVEGNPMTQSASKPGYLARHLSEVNPTPCPCGSSWRIITRDDCADAGFHVTHITDSKRHYHKRTTEIYHILEGSGVLEVGDDRVELRPGLTVLIEKDRKSVV